ncbi:MAG: CinA family protein [Verrucomicrobia bacterium]|nr:CinA family protein [Verrucomicrobiota bacterium]
MKNSSDFLAGKIIQKLHLSSQTTATAESCTGGLLAHTLTNVPGASAVFLEGVVSYSNDAKVNLLNVHPGLIETHGAVSAEVAQAMAEGVQKKSGATFGLATTGIAGPSGGSEEKPVGTVFLAIAQAGKLTKVWKEFFPEERLSFKEKVVGRILNRLLEE